MKRISLLTLLLLSLGIIYHSGLAQSQPTQIIAGQFVPGSMVHDSLDTLFIHAYQPPPGGYGLHPLHLDTDTFPDLIVDSDTYYGTSPFSRFYLDGPFQQATNPLEFFQEEIPGSPGAYRATIFSQGDTAFLPGATWARNGIRFNWYIPSFGPAQINVLPHDSIDKYLIFRQQDGPYYKYGWLNFSVTIHSDSTNPTIFGDINQVDLELFDYVIGSDSLFIGLEDEFTTLEPVIYPSPFTDRLHIRYPASGAGSVAGCYLFDLSGQCVREMHPNSSQAKEWLWELPDLSGGMYFLKIETGTGQVITRKVLKQ